jgi:uncharacterized protein YjbJ (UPF0337 family)
MSCRFHASAKAWRSAIETLMGRSCERDGRRFCAEKPRAAQREWDISHPRAGAILSSAVSALAHCRGVGSRTPSAASAHTNESHDMNKDQVQGIAKDIGGKVQETAGQVTGSREQEAKGVLKQAEGKVQKMLGDAKEIVEDAKK